MSGRHGRPSRSPVERGSGVPKIAAAGACMSAHSASGSLAGGAQAFIQRPPPLALGRDGPAQGGQSGEAACPRGRDATQTPARSRAWQRWSVPCVRLALWHSPRPPSTVILRLDRRTALDLVGRRRPVEVIPLSSCSASGTGSSGRTGGRQRVREPSAQNEARRRARDARRPVALRWRRSWCLAARPPPACRQG